MILALMTNAAVHAREKAQGIHYTPSALAQFVADRTVALLGAQPTSRVRVLDPACGDGELLLAAGRALRALGVIFELVGFEADAEATEVARARVHSEFGSLVQTSILCDDFLARVLAAKASESELWSTRGTDDRLLSSFDLVIANPPYVRTQVLGAERAQELVAAFGLTGRVDLYQAFIFAIRDVVHEGSPVGLIVSNRFLTVKAGATLRAALARTFSLDRIIDLGDTKVFQAAVLPALVFARRSKNGTDTLSLTSVYEDRSCAGDADVAATDVGLFRLLADRWSGVTTVGDRNFSIRNGEIPAVRAGQRPWVATDADDEWLNRVDKATVMRLGDLGKVRVGIKTTADKVFIRESWQGVDPQPEADLLLPLVTHHCVRRWRAQAPSRQVLYPYDLRQSRRVPVAIENWPGAAGYLHAHYDRLAGRKYVMAAGRKWWEIWVPQRPAEWKQPRLVFPDISERPCFSLDESGAVVNGDCYWLAFPHERRDVALLALAVANSTLAERYYDARCGNKLYAGRRRFITQYVEDFPVPDPSSTTARRIIDLVEELVGDASRAPELEGELDALVWVAFELEDMRG